LEGQGRNKKDDTTFHNIVAFGKPAEIIAQYSKKGKSCLWREELPIVHGMIKMERRNTDRK
jgi:single-stranded DNA-binding protein